MNRKRLRVRIDNPLIKITGVALLLLAAGYAGEVTVEELFPEARSQTEPFFRGNSGAVKMTITETVYKQTPQGELFTRVYAPAHIVPGKKYPCAVFFCGGGWINGALLQFGKQCEYLVSKGFIAMTPQYRMRDVHGTTPREAAEDAISCIRWVREHAGELGIDPDRILAGGGSAGGGGGGGSSGGGRRHADRDLFRTRQSVGVLPAEPAGAVQPGRQYRARFAAL
jgi:acetyl esterase/lipase